MSDDTSGDTEYTRTAKEFIKWIGDIEKVPFDTYDHVRAALAEAVHHLRYCERANVVDEYRIFNLANRVADLEQWEREAVETLAPLTGTKPPYTLSDVVTDVAAIIQENGLYRFTPPETRDTSEPRCPYCGMDPVSSTDGGRRGVYRCSNQDTLHRWTEGDPLVKRIRALEADLKAANVVKSVIGLIRENIRFVTGARISHKDIAADLEQLAQEVADNARLTAEVERLRGELRFVKKALAAAEERVKAPRPVRMEALEPKRMEDLDR